MTTPLSLIIRFAPPIPDLPVTISSPSTTTALKLHTFIRPHLPASLSTCPLRLISAGALLQPTTPLSLCLRLPPRIGSSISTLTSKSTPATSTLEPVYIHCAISTSSTLPAAALAAEYDVSIPTSSISQQEPFQEQQHQLPLGFDALLSAGLSPTEIASLRSQFLSLHAHIHTPDTMPSTHQMRLLEERWLDHNVGSGDGREGVGAGGGWNGGDDGESGALEDMFWGTVMGFFWAVGAVGWLIREEGVWSARRSGAVVMGVVINLAVCLLRGLR